MAMVLTFSQSSTSSQLAKSLVLLFYLIQLTSVLVSALCSADAASVLVVVDSPKSLNSITKEATSKQQQQQYQQQQKQHQQKQQILLPMKKSTSIHIPPNLLPIMLSDRMYRFVGETSGHQRTLEPENKSLDATSPSAMQVEDEINEKSSNTNVTQVNGQLNITTTDANIQSDGLPEYLNDEPMSNSTSAEVPEDILVQMGKMEPQEFIKRFVDMDSSSGDGQNNNNGNSNSININNSDDSNVDDPGEDDISLSMLMRGYGSGDSESTPSSTHPSNGGRGGRDKKVSSSPNLATCFVEMVTIELPKPEETVYYYPQCLRIGRCSGCCPSSRLKCTPTSISNTSVSVTVLKYNSEKRKFILSSIAKFNFEKHEHCGCQCIQQEKDCNSNQMYIPQECRCSCRYPWQAAACAEDPRKIWLSDQCKCACKTRSTCATGTVFNEETCRCEAKKVPNLLTDLGLIPSIKISQTSTFDLEFKKQHDFNSKVGASDGGINPDTGQRVRSNF